MRESGRGQIALNIHGGENTIMNKCDKCKNMARVTVSGAILPAYLCARHAGELCARVGDMAGVAHFTALMQGDRVAVSA